MAGPEGEWVDLRPEAVEQYADLVHPSLGRVVAVQQHTVQVDRAMGGHAPAVRLILIRDRGKVACRLVKSEGWIYTPLCHDIFTGRRIGGPSR